MKTKSTERSNARTKFNVDRDISKRTYEGIVFDSKMEMHYFRDVILPLVRSGEIVKYELQKPYELQPKFHNGDKTIHAIVYVADFYVEYSDGRTEVIDTKGYADSTAKMKRKMFWYQYPDTDYKWITYVKKYGGWIEYDKVSKLRREAKKERERKDIDKENDHGEKED